MRTSIREGHYSAFYMDILICCLKRVHLGLEPSWLCPKVSTLKELAGKGHLDFQGDPQGRLWPVIVSFYFRVR